MKYDTNRKPDLEPGIYRVRVSAYPQSVKTANGFEMIGFEFVLEGNEKPIKQRFFPNQLKSMFQALGFKEVETGVFDGNIDEAYDRIFKAELYFEEFKRDDGTTGKARRLRNFTAPESIKPEDIAWEE